MINVRLCVEDATPAEGETLVPLAVVTMELLRQGEQTLVNIKSIRMIEPNRPLLAVILTKEK